MEIGGGQKAKLCLTPVSAEPEGVAKVHGGIGRVGSRLALDST
jgi:hypothetical protein